MKWFRFYHDALDDPKVQRLPGDVFRARLLAAINGEENEFSPFIGRGIEERLPYPQWRELREEVFCRDDYTCQYCGDTAGPLECDHVVPLIRCGSNAIENLTTACRTCNRAKHTKLVGEWL